MGDYKSRLEAVGALPVAGVVGGGGAAAARTAPVLAPTRADGPARHRAVAGVRMTLGGWLTFAGLVLSLVVLVADTPTRKERRKP